MRVSLILLVTGLCACADEEPTADPYKCIAQGGAGCFELPTEPIAAADAMGNAVTPALDCAEYQVTTSTAPVTFTGKTLNLINMAMIPNVRVEVFADSSLTMLLAETMSNDTADYTATIDNMPSKAAARVSADGNQTIVYENQRIDVSVTQHDMFNFFIATRPNVAQVIELVGDQWLAGKSHIAGFAFDCAGNRLVNVVVNVAPGSGANGTRLYEPGVKTYYGIEGSVPVLARRTQLAMTTSSGTYAATNLAPGKHFLQIWGFPSEAALMMGGKGLVMLGEEEIHVPSAESLIGTAVHNRLR